MNHLMSLLCVDIIVRTLSKRLRLLKGSINLTGIINHIKRETGIVNLCSIQYCAVCVQYVYDTRDYYLLELEVFLQQFLCLSTVCNSGNRGNLRQYDADEALR
jgi:hypothetical protein